jgi:hypothetical protein
MRRLQCAAALAVLFAAAGLRASVVAGGGQSDEAAPSVRAVSILAAAQRSGPHFSVDDRVTVAGYFYEFHLTSDYGPFTAVGRSELATRIDEIRAIAALQDVSKSEVFLASAGGAVVDIGKGAASAVTDPVATAKGVGAGIKRFGVNLGRASKRAVEKEGGAETGESGAGTAANTVLGVSSAMREWARKVKADPYTTNLVLRNALQSVAKVDAAGSIVTKVVVPIPAVVGATAAVGDLVWSKDPEALRKLNEERVRALGTPEKTASAFFRSGWYTLTLQTRIIAALDAVRKPGCADYIASASAADTEREALFFVESAEMLQRHHAKTPVDKLLGDSRAIVAAADGNAVLLAPLDFIRSTSTVRNALAEIASRARRELGASSLVLHVSGTLSDRARQDAKSAGWTVRKSGA